jgi:hypothetical protein
LQLTIKIYVSNLQKIRDLVAPAEKSNVENIISSISTSRDGLLKRVGLTTSEGRDEINETKRYIEDSFDTLSNLFEKILKDGSKTRVDTVQPLVMGAHSDSSEIRTTNRRSSEIGHEQPVAITQMNRTVLPPSKIVITLSDIKVKIALLKPVVDFLVQEKDNIKIIRKKATEDKRDVEALDTSYRNLITDIKSYNPRIWDKISQEDVEVGTAIQTMVQSFSYIKEGIRGLDDVMKVLTTRFDSLHEIAAEYLSYRDESEELR